MTIRTRRVLFVVFLSVLPSIMTSQATTPAKPTTPTSAAVTTGKNIGTIISTAFDTAFPIVGKIMDLFKKSSSQTTETTTTTSDKKKKGAPASTSAPPATEKTATESEVQTAVTKAQGEAKSAFKAELQPIIVVAQELGVIETLATDGSLARQNIVNIQRMLAQASPDYSKIGTEWKKFGLQMGDVLTMDESKIKLVQDASIKGKIFDLQKTRSQLMVDISDNIDRAKASQKDFSKREFEGQISAMGELLNGFGSLAAAELETLQSDINNVATWANTPAGKSTFKTPPPNAKLLNIAAKAVQIGQAAYHVDVKQQ